MPETRQNRYASALLRITFVALTATLPSCHLFVNPTELTISDPPSARVASSGSSSSSRSSVVRKFIPSVQHLEFQIDSSISTGTIDLALDHDSLAPRRSVCECPLKGTIVAKLQTSASGVQTLTLEKIELVTAGEGKLEFVWSPIIGTVRMLIPEGQLKISSKSSDSVIQLSEGGRFSHPGYHFQVDGTGQVEATGLVLRKKIGDTETDLTIEETEAVTLAGTLRRKDSSWHLELPGTVMKDSFEIDEEGTTLDLIFTGNIISFEK